MSVGVDCIALAACDDDEVARQRPEIDLLFCIDRPGILEREGYVADEVDGIPLRTAVFSLNDRPGCGRVDGLAPTVAILQTDAEEEVLEQVGPVETHIAIFGVDSDEIEGVSLAEDIRPVAGDFRAGRVGGVPFAPQGEIDDDGSEYRRILDVGMYAI